MVTRAEIGKLAALHAVEPTMLSLYLAVPPAPADLSVLTARAGELVDAAEAAAGRAVPERDRNSVREKLAACAGDWPGPAVAIFACAGSGLLEAVPLPCPLPERAVLGIRPHIRPLLLARQRRAGLRAGRVAAEILAMPPGGLSAVGLPSCLAAVSAGAVQTLVVPGDGLVPGYECGRCGTLSLVADNCCPDWGTAALPVPDVIEEMVVRILEDGGEVWVICEGSSPVAARLSCPVPQP